MHFLLVALQFEFFTQRVRKLVRTVALYGKATAGWRRFRRECANDHMSTRLQRAQQVVPARPPLFRFGKKMKDGTVVPQIVLVVRQFDRGDIAIEPCNTLRFVTEACFGDS